MEIPKCVKNESDTPQCVQTYVLKLGRNESRDAGALWLYARIIDGAGIAAMVQVYTVGDDPGFYLVVTENAAHRDGGRERALKASLQQTVGNPQVEWVAPMSRRLQRLFGWGDVVTTREDVVRASKAGDIDELKRIMPEALAYLDSEDLDLDTMPYLYDELQRPPPPPKPHPPPRVAHVRCVRCVTMQRPYGDRRAPPHDARPVR